MRDIPQIRELLDELDHRPANELEDQDIDFKEWNARSMSDAVSLVVEMAVCMANGGGGTVVFGVNDKVIGRAHSIIGVPPEVDVNHLKKAVYDATDPKLTPVFQELSVPEGTGRLKRRAEKGHQGLQNSEVRKITHFDRQQVNRLIHELEAEGLVRIEGHGRGARYHYSGQGDA